MSEENTNSKRPAVSAYHARTQAALRWTPTKMIVLDDGGVFLTDTAGMTLVGIQAGSKACPPVKVGDTVAYTTPEGDLHLGTVSEVVTLKTCPANGFSVIPTKRGGK